MSAVGGPEVLQVVVDFPKPERGSRVLIKTTSAGVNPVDLAVRGGRYKPETMPKVRGRHAGHGLAWQRQKRR